MVVLFQGTNTETRLPQEVPSLLPLHNRVSMGGESVMVEKKGVPHLISGSAVLMSGMRLRLSQMCVVSLYQGFRRPATPTGCCWRYGSGAESSALFQVMGRSDADDGIESWSGGGVSVGGVCGSLFFFGMQGMPVN